MRFMFGSRKVGGSNATVDADDQTRQYGRLGNEALGPHAYEKQMPQWQKKSIVSQQGVLRSLQYGPEARIAVPILDNENTNIIPALQTLSASDRNVSSFVFCHPAVNHIANRPRQGGFCGFHSITMMLSYLRGCGTAPKHPIYSSALPNILEIQELIENAWAIGIHSQAKLETGGIIGTRKYIGTPEAHACLQILDVPCFTEVIDSSRITGQACDAVIDRIKTYFLENKPKDNILGKPPVYFQRKGHSMVIVGFETWRERKLHYPGIGLVDSPHLDNLIVFDCAVPVPDAIKALRDGQNVNEKRRMGLMSKYRVSRYDLEDDKRFELVFLAV